METGEKEEKEINDALSLSEEERSMSSGIFNILGTSVKGEPLQILHTSGFEAWRKPSKKSGTLSKHAMNNGKNNAESKRELNWRRGRRE